MKISAEQLQLISLLERETGAQAMDVLGSPESVVFLVKQGDLGKAIGKNGTSLQKLSRKMGKRVEFVEFNESLDGFLGNLFKPVQIHEIQKNSALDGGQSIVLKVDFQNKGLAIGKGGSKINRARELAKRHFGVSELKIM